MTQPHNPSDPNYPSPYPQSPYPQSPQPQSPQPQSPQPQSPQPQNPYQASPYGQNPYQPANDQIPYPGQQLGYGQPTFHSPAPTKRGGKGGMITFFIGLGILILGLVFIIASAMKLAPMVSDGIVFTDTTTVVGGSPDEIAHITAGEPATTPSCTVTNPSGAPVALEKPSTPGTISGTNTIGSFMPTMSGNYTVTCTGAKEFIVSKLNASKLIVPGLFIMSGLLMLPLGFILGLIGLILWLVGRRKFVQA